eukprot:2111695-Prymnesium_polylepis.2
MEQVVDVGVAALEECARLIRRSAASRAAVAATCIVRVAARCRGAGRQRQVMVVVRAVTVLSEVGTVGRRRHRTVFNLWPCCRNL